SPTCVCVLQAQQSPELCECGPVSSFQSLWSAVSAWPCWEAAGDRDICLRGLPLCMVFQWRFRSDALMKALSQEPQLKGRSPRCCRSWSFRWDLCLKAFSHIWQAKGLSLLWTRSCRFRSGPLMKALPQTTQRCVAPSWCCGPRASCPWSDRSRGRGGRKGGTPASCR
uniref:Uncharacterized protein n=1 Tax=Nothobranchius furzeri TaxID=105023 RepID=A0A8C6NXT5_NOTFU